MLFGAHCFFIHPFYVARAWWKLYGFPWDPRLWVAFFVHDLGYLGKPNMDGPEGESHPRLGAAIMHCMFDPPDPLNRNFFNRSIGRVLARIFGIKSPGHLNWYSFSFYHSRFLAKNYGVEPSQLCAADKLATAITPACIYLPMVNLTGEVHEYLAMHNEAVEGRGKYRNEEGTRWNTPVDQKEWHRRMTTHMARWAWKNR